ncbi:MAG: hypothetical protein U9N81_01140 [Bacillota bacterium]|nr:hypothetical protein [Bacillota bacterium]
MFSILKEWLSKLLKIQRVHSSHPWDNMQDRDFAEWMDRRGLHPMGNAKFWASDE